MLDAREQGGRARAVFVAVMVLVGVRYFGCRARTFLTMQLKHLDVQPNEMGPMGVSMYATLGGCGGAQLKSKFKSSTGAETLSYVMVENSNNLILCMRFWIATVMLGVTVGVQAMLNYFYTEVDKKPLPSGGAPSKYSRTKMYEGLTRRENPLGTWPVSVR